MIRTELQGSKGAINKLKKNVIPSGNSLTKITINKLGITNDKLSGKECRRMFNDLLFSGLIEEYKLYRSMEEKLYEKIFEEFLNPNKELKKQCPQTVKKINEVIREVGKSTDAKKTGFKIFMLMTSLIPPIDQSLSQGRSTRAGGSLQNHLSNLFKIAEFKFETQTKLNGPVDFLFPSIEYFNKYKHDAVILSAKRTLRERWKQDSNYIKLADIGRLYIATAEGVNFLDGKISPLPEPKLLEIRNSNISLIVHDSVKNRYHNDDSYIIGYTEFANEILPHYAELWTKRGYN